MRYIVLSIVAFICLILLIIITAILATAILAIGGLAWLFPPKIRHTIIAFLLKIPVLWTSIVNLLMSLPANHEWDIQDKGDLNAKKWYLLIANHQSWLDILIIGYVFNRKIPVLKFFMKKQLLWSLPIAGLACWLLGYPFMRRHTHKEIHKHPELKNRDTETTKQACRKFKWYPTSVMNFLEGTRFTAQKRQRQHSPYMHLLKPKAGGAAVVINELHDCLHGILNVTIHYSNPKITLLNFFFSTPCKITVRYELLPVTADLIGDYYENRDFRIYFQRWLNLIWERKDLLLDELNRGQS